MKSTPILYTPAMVQAILDGRKTQTRRIATGDASAVSIRWVDQMDTRPETGARYSGWVKECSAPLLIPMKCPYGQAGDKLYVREEHYQFGHWEEIPDVKTKKGRTKWKFVPDSKEIVFAPPHEHFRKGRHHKDPETKAWHKRLARFMPKAASRITLEIVNVRVERLKAITVQDCEAEGIDLTKLDIREGEAGNAARIRAYKAIWESINGPDSWERNPWVWAITFKRI